VPAVHKHTEARVGRGEMSAAAGASGDRVLASANYFHFRKCDVISDVTDAMLRNWLTIKFMLMMLQACASFSILFYFMILQHLFYLILDVWTALNDTRARELATLLCKSQMVPKTISGTFGLQDSMPIVLYL